MQELPMRQFSDRHIGPTNAERAIMLAEIGLDSVDALIDATVPASIRNEELALAAPLSEAQAVARIREIADENQVFTSLIGTGYHGTITPGVLRRNILENPAWYTAYTPYQPEISQGRLEWVGDCQRIAARRRYSSCRSHGHAAAYVEVEADGITGRRCHSPTVAGRVADTR